MSLLKKEEVPKDAIPMTVTEAIDYQWRIISGWNELSDTWALRFGCGILAGISSLNGMVLNAHYRNKFRLGTYGQLSCLIPIVMLPGMLTALFHRQVVSTNMLLQRKHTCLTCYELRSAAVQLAFGMAYPMLLAPTSSLMFANSYATYRLPSIFEQPKEIFKLVMKMSRPLQGYLTFMCAFQLFASSVLTYCEMNNHAVVLRKISELEDMIENENIRD